MTAKKKTTKKLIIVDRYGYYVADLVGEGSAEEDSFMAGHDYMLGHDGSRYYMCNGYGWNAVEDPMVHDCEIAMSHGMACQCGEHE